MRSKALMFAVRRLSLICLLVIAAPVIADERIGHSGVEALQQVFDRIAAESGTVGAQVSVVLGDRRVDLVYGAANVALGAQMTKDTSIQIGSSTKVFNAAMIMTLVDEGALDLDTPVQRYFPGFKLADAAAAKTMTLRQLLSMSAGIDNGAYTVHDGQDALAQYIASLNTLPQAFPPGAYFGYSNAGTDIAGYVAQVVKKQSWDALLRDRILNPASLTTAETRAEELPYYRVSLGYMPKKNDEPAVVKRPWYITQGQGPAGSTLAMSAHDLASFGSLFVRGGQTLDGKRVLSESALKTMMTPTINVPAKSIATAWGVGPLQQMWNGTPVWGHPGGNQSGASYLLWIPKLQGVFAVTTNTPEAGSSMMTQVIAAFAPRVFGLEAPKLSAPKTPVRVAAAPYLGTYSTIDTQYVVTQEKGTLFVDISSTNPDVRATDRHPLTALGDDRFMYLGKGDHPAEVAFFGKDAKGRRTGLIAPYFPARRVE